jgi:hypothetical protein
MSCKCGRPVRVVVPPHLPMPAPMSTSTLSRLSPQVAAISCMICCTPLRVRVP